MIKIMTIGGICFLKSRRKTQRKEMKYLKSSVHDLWQRTRHDRNRPLLQTADPRAKLKELYDLRDPLYTEVADLIMPTGKQSVHSLLQQLQQELERIQESG